MFRKGRFYSSEFYKWDEFDLENTTENQLYYNPKPQLKS